MKSHRFSKVFGPPQTQSLSEYGMSCGLVDFHCHLDLYPDHVGAVGECEQAGVDTLTVTTTPKAWPRNREVAARTRHVRVALGLHPQLVADRASELKLWQEYLPQAQYVGEVGLDAGPRFYPSLEIQERVFRTVLRLCAEMGGKILTVHSVRATTRVLNLIEAHLPPDRAKVVLHWFTGRPSEARRAVDLGCYFSINAEMLRNDRHKKLVATLPLSKLLTETDGPFTQHCGRPAHPRDIGTVVELLAQARNCSSVNMRSTIRSNLRCLESALLPNA